MENMTGKIGVDDKGIRRGGSLRFLWMFLIAIFAAVIIFRVVSWSRGEGDGLYGILSPLGMIFVGLVQIPVTGNKAVRSILLIVAMVLVLAGLVFTLLR